MKHALFIILAVVLLMTGCTSQHGRWEKEVSIDSLTSMLYDMMSDRPEQALAFIDSLKDEGIYSDGIANKGAGDGSADQF